MPNPEEKTKRIIQGATVAGVVLLVFLLIVMIYQFVRIGVLSAEKKRLTEEINALEQEIENNENSLEYYSSAFYLEQLAREYGCVNPPQN